MACHQSLSQKSGVIGLCPNTVSANFAYPILFPPSPYRRPDLFRQSRGNTLCLMDEVAVHLIGEPERLSGEVFDTRP